MSVLSFTDSLIFSMIRRLRHRGGRMAVQGIGPFRLHRFPAAPSDGDKERGFLGQTFNGRFHSLRTFILIFSTFIITFLLTRAADKAHFFQAKFETPKFTAPKTDWWPSTSPFPVMGASTFDSEMYFPPRGSNFYPVVASYNQPPRHRSRTPLLIPFTRNNKMMIQTVLGYISSGWPREDIIIVDNSGTFDANNRNLLSEDNPFYLDYDLFRNRYGVAILQTPTLLNFAQLQNFMLRTAISRDWSYYFWSHMDVGILSREESTPYKSFYQRIFEVLDASFPGKNKDEKPWGAKFFNFDYLTMINVETWRHVGQWDVFVPYYTTDCDAYGRLQMLGYRIDNVDAGHIWDVAECVSDPESKFFPASSLTNSISGPLAGNDNKEVRGHYDQEGPNSTRYKSLVAEFDRLQEAKHKNKGGRNTWQDMQKGGKGEPWTYDPAGFQTAWWEMADAGRRLYGHKWGTGACDLLAEKKTLGDMWKDAGKIKKREVDMMSYRYI